MRRLRLVAAGAAAVALSAFAIGAAGAGATDSEKGGKVQVGDDFFNPTKVSISKGKKVRFTWIGTDRHNVTKAKGPGGTFSSGTINQTGFVYKHKFKKSGTYNVICTVHEEMKVKVKVK